MTLTIEPGEKARNLKLKVGDGADRVVTEGRTYLEEALAAAVKLHAEADAAGLAGAGELTEQSGEDGAGQRLLQGERVT